jgi:hypothetical protein
MAEGHNLIMVSNRLPITIKKKDAGNYQYSMSSGGLVSGLSGMTKTTTFSWFGWPGLELPEGDVPKVEEELKEQYNAVPIWLPDEMADRHCTLLCYYPAMVAAALLATLQAAGCCFTRYPTMQRVSYADATMQTTDSPTPSSGRSSTTTPVRFPSTRMHGLHTATPTVSSPKKSPNQ